MVDAGALVFPGWLTAHRAGVPLRLQHLGEPLRVRPTSLSLYARFQRDLASGVTSVWPRRRSVSRSLRRPELPVYGTLPCGRDCARSSPWREASTSHTDRLWAGRCLTRWFRTLSVRAREVRQHLAGSLLSCRGRCWVRTSDLLGVNEARSHCANRPRGGGGNRTRVQGFAGPCLSHSATPPAPTFPAGGILAWTSEEPCGPGPAGRNPAPPSGRRDSNPRPSPWQGDALPTEPRPHAGALPSERIRPGGCAFRTVADPGPRANSGGRRAARNSGRAGPTGRPRRPGCPGAREAAGRLRRPGCPARDPGIRMCLGSATRPARRSTSRRPRARRSRAASRRPGGAGPRPQARRPRTAARTSGRAGAAGNRPRRSPPLSRAAR